MTMMEQIQELLDGITSHDLLDSLRQSHARDSILYSMLTQSGDLYPVSWCDEVVPDYLRLPEGL